MYHKAVNGKKKKSTFSQLNDFNSFIGIGCGLVQFFFRQFFKLTGLGVENKLMRVLYVTFPLYSVIDKFHLCVFYANLVTLPILCGRYTHRHTHTSTSKQREWVWTFLGNRRKSIRSIVCFFGSFFIIVNMHTHFSVCSFYEFNVFRIK